MRNCAGGQVSMWAKNGFNIENIVNLGVTDHHFPRPCRNYFLLPIGHSHSHFKPQHHMPIGKQLKSGDVLMVTRLDRLARSTRDLLNILDTVAKAGAGFKSLSDPWCDSTSAHGRLMLTVLGGLAEFERELIRACFGWVELGDSP